MIVFEVHILPHKLFDFQKMTHVEQHIVRSYDYLRPRKPQKHRSKLLPHE